MSKNTTKPPFNYGFDFSKLAADMKWPSSDMKWPSFDMAPVSDLFQRYVETLTAANQTLTEGLQAIAKRQAEITRSSVEELSTIVGQLSSAGTPEDKIVRQIELCKQSYEAALANAKELAELAAKSNNEAASLWAGHISDSFDDIKTVTQKATRKKAA